MNYDLLSRIISIVKTDINELLEISTENWCEKINKLFSDYMYEIETCMGDVVAVLSELDNSTSYKAVIPDSINEGLKKGIYVFTKSKNETLAQIRNKNTGEIVRNLRLEEMKELSSNSKLQLSNLSMQISNQLLLTEIQSSIEDLSYEVNLKLDSIIRNQIDDTLSKADACFLEFERFKKNNDNCNFLISRDEVISSLRRKIENFTRMLIDIDSKKNNILKNRITKKLVGDAENYVSEIYELLIYLQLVYLVDFDLSKNIQLLEELNQFLDDIFTSDLCYILTGWERKPHDCLEYKSFWLEDFCIYKQNIATKIKALNSDGGDNEFLQKM